MVDEITGKGQLDQKAESILEKSMAPAARIQNEVAWRYLSIHLRELTRQKEKILDVLDVGCWLAEVSLRLASEGHRVTLLEPSSCLLQSVHEQAEREMPQVCNSISYLNKRIEDLEECQVDDFDLVICHETIEYVDDPLRALQIITRVLRPRGLLSLVFLNRYGEVIYQLMEKRDIQAAVESFDKERFKTDLHKGWGHLYSCEELCRLLDPLGYTIEGEYGLRIFSEYIDRSLLEQEETFKKVADLEERAGQEANFRGIGRFVQVIARKD
jgi:S-adenosylmethionine-dependent methyltransferase